MATVVIEPLKADVGSTEHYRLNFLCLKHNLLGVGVLSIGPSRAERDISLLQYKKNLLTSERNENWELKSFHDTILVLHTDTIPGLRCCFALA